MSEAEALWASLTICSIVLTGVSTGRCWAGGAAGAGAAGAGVAAKGGGGGGVRRRAGASGGTGVGLFNGFIFWSPVNVDLLRKNARFLI